jgi:hypothetical protein
MAAVKHGWRATVLFRGRDAVRYDGGMDANPYETPRNAAKPLRWRLDKWFWGWAILNVAVLAATGALIGFGASLLSMASLGLLQVKNLWTVAFGIVVGALIGAVTPLYAIQLRMARIQQVKRLRAEK